MVCEIFFSCVVFLKRLKHDTQEKCGILLGCHAQFCHIYGLSEEVMDVRIFGLVIFLLKQNEFMSTPNMM
jgi:hypothetical protein